MHVKGFKSNQLTLLKLCVSSLLKWFPSQFIAMKLIKSSPQMHTSKSHLTSFWFQAFILFALSLWSEHLEQASYCIASTPTFFGGFALKGWEDVACEQALAQIGELARRPERMRNVRLGGGRERRGCVWYSHTKTLQDTNKTSGLLINNTVSPNQKRYHEYNNRKCIWFEKWRQCRGSRVTCLQSHRPFLNYLILFWKNASWVRGCK